MLTDLTMISDDDSSDEFQPSKIIISKKSNYFPAINKNPGILVAGKNNQDIEAIIISDDDCMNSTDSSVSPNLTINYNIDKGTSKVYMNLNIFKYKCKFNY